MPWCMNVALLAVVTCVLGMYTQHVHMSWSDHEGLNQ